MGEECIQSSIGHPEGKRPFRGSRHRREDNIKTHPKEWEDVHESDSRYTDWAVNKYYYSFVFPAMHQGIGVRFPAEKRDFNVLHWARAGCGDHPTSCLMGSGGPFYGVKAAGVWNWLLACSDKMELRRGADKSSDFPICSTTKRIFLGWVEESRTTKS
jgi:hypothetical protein